MQQAEDFRAESQALADILQDLPEQAFSKETLFKGWTIEDVLGHLHMFNFAAELTLKDEEAFAAFMVPIYTAIHSGKSLLEAQYPWLDGLSGRALFDDWWAATERTADAYASADPKQRVKWAGPDMSALSSITARQMEVWAHAHEVFDVLGLQRIEKDRIRNIAHLGVSTFGWTFINRKQPVPEPAPFVRLTAPSGAVWEWNEPQDDNVVEGSAVEFAQVVTQTRGFRDTSLSTVGSAAKNWMEIAQCFAGPPETPPAKGDRHVASV